MNDIVRDTNKEARVNSIVDFVVTFLEDVCNDNPYDEKLNYLKEDIKLALDNYNTPDDDEEDTEDDNVQTGDQEDLCG